MAVTIQASFFLTAFDRGRGVPEADGLETFGTIACGLLQLSCGKQLKVAKVKADQQLGTYAFRESNLSCFARIALIAVYILTFPVSIPLTIAGIFSLNCSGSYSSLFNDLLHKQKETVHETGAVSAAQGELKEKAIFSEPEKTQGNEPSKIVQPKRAGFQNSGTNCFMAAAMQCLATVRSSLPMDASNLQHENQKAGQAVLDVLDKVLGGIEGSDGELEALKKKLGLNGMGDARDAFLRLASILGIEHLKIFHNGSWLKSSNPIFIKENNNPYLIKNDGQKGSFTYQFPLANENEEKLNFLSLNRAMLSQNIANRKPADIPQRIFVPLANQKDQFDEYELVATAQSLGGHAIAYSKFEEGWMVFDDAKICKITNEEAEKEISKHSMILVYRLKA